LNDADVTEVMCNGPTRIYVERNGKIVKAATSFIDENHLKRIIEKIVAQVGRRVDESNPMVDARLPDGSRANAVIAPLAIGRPVPRTSRARARSASATWSATRCGCGPTGSWWGSAGAARLSTCSRP